MLGESRESISTIYKLKVQPTHSCTASLECCVYTASLCIRWHWQSTTLVILLWLFDDSKLCVPIVTLFIEPFSWSCSYHVTASSLLYGSLDPFELCIYFLSTWCYITSHVMRSLRPWPSILTYHISSNKSLLQINAGLIYTSGYAKLWSK